MELVLAGKVAGLVTMFVICGLILWRIAEARAGRIPAMRKLPQFDAIDEVIGRCVELGRPIHVSPGRGGLVDVEAPQVLAGLEVMSYVASKAAQLDAQIIATVCQAEVYPVAEAIVREAFIAAGKEEAFKPEMVRYLSPNQFAYAAGILGIYSREKPAGNIYIGLFFAESLLLLEGGYLIGAMQVGGTANTLQSQFFVACCDYALLGEEIFVAGAYLSKNPLRLGAILGQDLGKLLFMAMILVGVILRAFGNTTLPNLLSK